MSKYLILRSARNDIRNIWDYIAGDNLRAADMVSERLRRAFELLGDLPGLGHARADVSDTDLLFWNVGAYVIVYRKRDKVEVLAVLHGAQDIPELVAGRLPG